ncbi:MAG: hypothetical protein ABW060_04855 [Solirubrobacteraceae bacterium]
MLPRLLLGTAAALLLAAPAASASSVAYTEGGNIVLSSADGAKKLALTTDGTPVSPYYTPAQSANGVTVAARQEQFDSMRAVLHAWSASDGLETAANVMPRNALYTDTVMPIRMDIAPDGKAVAFGYSTCGIGGCINRTNGYWLTFAQNGPANPSRPQGSTGLVAPSFFGNRIVSSDTFKVMAQEAINAPFNDGHAGWIDPGNAGARFWAAEVRPDGKAVAIEFSSPSTGFGVVLASADGLGGATELKCFLPAAGEATDVSWSPDGSMLAWADDGGVKVARAPDLSAPPAAEDKCVLGSAVKVLSATGADPNFGGADVAAMIAARGGKTPPPGGDTPDPVPARSVAVKAPGKVRVKRGFKATVTAPGAGGVVAKLLKGRKVVGSGRATAAAAGPVKVKVKLRRGVRARSLRGKSLTLRVVWSGASGDSSTATATVRAR